MLGAAEMRKTVLVSQELRALAGEREEEWSGKTVRGWQTQNALSSVWSGLSPPLPRGRSHYAAITKIGGFDVLSYQPVGQLLLGVKD